LKEAFSQKYYIYATKISIGVRRLFSRGGQNFPGGAGGAKHTICLKNT